MSRLRGARCTIRRANAADGNAAPGTENAVVERRKASALRQGRVRRKAQVWCASRRSAPLARMSGSPGMRKRERGAAHPEPRHAPGTRKAVPQHEQETKANAHARNTDDEDEPVLTEAERDASRRKLHDFLSFWRVCTLKACKRGKGCRGDAAACTARHFPMLPDDAKAWLYKAFQGRLDGLSPQEAADAATKHVAEVNEVLARHAQRAADAAAAKARAATPPAAPARTDEASPPRLRPTVRVRAL